MTLKFQTIIKQVKKLRRYQAITLDDTDFNDFDDIEAQQLIEELVKVGSPAVKVREYIFTPLHFAAFIGKIQTIKWLIDYGHASITETNSGGDTVLIAAACNGQTATAQWLVENNYASIKEKDNMGNTALLIAAGRGHNPIIEWLLKIGASIKESNQDSLTTLLLAAGNGYIKTVQCSLKHWGALITERNKNGHTALLMAAYNGHLPIVQYLLKEGGASITERDKHGHTALLLAAYNGHLPIVQYLLKEGGASITERNNKGDTALLLATFRGHIKIIQEVLKNGASIKESNKDGHTVLLLAAGHNHPGIVQWLLERGGSSITEKDNDGQTAIQIAKANGHLELASYLKLFFDSSCSANLTNSPKKPMPISRLKTFLKAGIGGKIDKNSLQKLESALEELGANLSKENNILLFPLSAIELDNASLKLLKKKRIQNLSLTLGCIAAIHELSELNSDKMYSVAIKEKLIEQAQSMCVNISNQKQSEQDKIKAQEEKDKIYALLGSFLACPELKPLSFKEAWETLETVKQKCSKLTTEIELWVANIPPTHKKVTQKNNEGIREIKNNVTRLQETLKLAYQLTSIQKTCNQLLQQWEVNGPNTANLERVKSLINRNEEACPRQAHTLMEFWNTIRKEYEIERNKLREIANSLEVLNETLTRKQGDYSIATNFAILKQYQHTQEQIQKQKELEQEIKQQEEEKQAQDAIDTRFAKEREEHKAQREAEKKRRQEAKKQREQEAKNLESSSPKNHHVTTVNTMFYARINPRMKRCQELKAPAPTLGDYLNTAFAQHQVNQSLSPLQKVALANSINDFDNAFDNAVDTLQRNQILGYCAEAMEQLKKINQEQAEFSPISRKIAKDFRNTVYHTPQFLLKAELKDLRNMAKMLSTFAKNLSESYLTFDNFLKEAGENYSKGLALFNTIISHKPNTQRTKSEAREIVDWLLQDIEACQQELVECEHLSQTSSRDLSPAVRFICGRLGAHLSDLRKQYPNYYEALKSELKEFEQQYQMLGAFCRHEPETVGNHHLPIHLSQSEPHKNKEEVKSNDEEAPLLSPSFQKISSYEREILESLNHYTPSGNYSIPLLFSSSAATPAAPVTGSAPTQASDCLPLVPKI